MKICIIGAGVIGAMTAYYLAQEGHDITILEKGEKPAPGASSANASQLSYSYLSPMGHPDILKTIPNILMGKEKSVRIVNLFRLDVLLWSLRFVNQSRLINFKKNREKLASLSLQSKNLMEEFIAQHESDMRFDYRKSGRLVIFDKPEYLSKGTETTKVLNAYGLDQEILDEQEAITLEPWLESQKGKFCGGFYTKEDATSDCEMFVTKLLDFLKNKYSVSVQYGVKIRAFHNDEKTVQYISDTKGRQYKSDKFVLAAGAWSQVLGRKLGLNLGVMPAKGCTIDWEYPVNTKVPTVSIADYRDKIVFAPLEGRLRISKYMLLGDHQLRQNLQLVDGIVKQAELVDPSWDIENYKVYSGLRPMTVDSIPIIRQSKYQNFYVNSGQGMLGWTLAPASAKRCAEIVLA